MQYLWKRHQSGFTLVEILLVMSVFSIMVAIATVNLANFQHKSQLSATVNAFLADLKSQQVKAMTGDVEGGTSASNYGVSFGNTNYTLYRNSLGTNNFVVTFPSTIQITETLQGTDIVFLKGSGEVSGFIDGQNTITLLDTADGSQKVITVNRYGVVTGVN